MIFMRNFFKKLSISLLGFSMIFSFHTFSPTTSVQVQAASTSRIHYLTLPDNTIAVLLECNGQFGMVDSGEDNDYPTGSDSRYPYRDGIVKGNGYEDDVISYLESVGVTQDNFEFYIGTHPHSDHIGSADEVIRAFHPKRVYIQEYKDSYVSFASNLWDNLYVYDNMIAAAQEVGATIIQNFDTSAPVYPEQVTVSGKVIWDDGENKDGIRPSELKITLTNPVTSAVTEQTIYPDSDTGEWSYCFDQLYKYDDTKTAINYQVTVTAPDGYTVSSSSEASFDFICSHTVTTADQTISVIWDDADAPSNIRPASLDLTLQQSVTSDDKEASWEDVENYSITPDTAGGWTINIKLQETDDAGNPIHYRLVVNSQSENYEFSTDDTSLTVTAAYTGDEADTASGIQDDTESVAALNTETSDGMSTSSIPATDQVDPNNTDDPINARSSSAASARTGQYENLSKTQYTTSTPNFTLGGSMQIEIVHYGGDYKTNPKPDANYFSLGVKVTANGKTAFLSGDINNYEGAETALANQLGHIDILTLGHHGYYGSNTYSYITKLNPKVMIMPGNYKAVSNNTTPNGEQGTLDTLLAMGAKGIPLYATAWYHDYVPALVFNFNSALSNNIPTGKAFIGGAESVSPAEHIYYKNGIPTAHTGWVTSNGYTCYFNGSYSSVRNRWIKDSAGRYSYLTSDGTMAVGWASDQDVWYYFSDDGYMQTGWIQYQNRWYYLDSSGAMVIGAQTINGAQYYFNTNGAMLTSAWANGKFYGADGIWIPNYKNTNWRRDNNGWWYHHTDGSWPSNQWECIDGYWYYFNAKGYMVTGWLKQNSTWYYLNDDGIMQVGFHKIRGVWYYMNASGAMQTGWIKISNAWYYFNNNGAMMTGWQKIGGIWYYLDASGAMQTGWQKVGGSWYYMNSSGAMQTGWIKSNNTWYYLSGSGAMLGEGWHWISGKCYYMDASGAMAANTWIGSYYVGASGAWIPNYSPAKWIKNGSRWWYRHADGSYTVSNWEYINGSWYYFDSEGWMKTGWLNLGNTWYYLYDNGAMASNTTINGYYVDASGAWVP